MRLGSFFLGSRLLPSAWGKISPSNARRGASECGRPFFGDFRTIFHKGEPQFFLVIEQLAFLVLFHQFSLPPRCRARNLEKPGEVMRHFLKLEPRIVSQFDSPKDREANIFPTKEAKYFPLSGISSKIHFLQAKFSRLSRPLFAFQFPSWQKRVFLFFVFYYPPWPFVRHLTNKLFELWRQHATFWPIHSRLVWNSSSYEEWTVSHVQT